MQKIGLIGGISWIATMDYYSRINLGVNEKLGGLNSSICTIHSLNYAEIKRNNDNHDWENTFGILRQASLELKQSGAKAILLCANTMHYLADRLENEIGLPIIHIATATANEIRKQGLRKVGLLGTRFTMELDFFKSKLTEKGIEVIIPDANDRDFVHTTIFEELGKGIVTEATKTAYLQIIDKMLKMGAEGIILGCTEIPLVIKSDDLTVSIFDTLELHAAEAVRFQLQEA